MRRPAPVDGWVILLLLGLPAALIRVAGWPLPATLPTHAQITAWLEEPFAELSVIAMAVWAGWLLWLLLATVAVVEGYRWLARRRRRPRLQLPQPAQLLTATLVGTATVGAAQTGAAAADTGDTTATVDNTPGGSAVIDAAMAGAGTARQAPATIHVGAVGHQHIVERGDTLWKISQQRLGTPSRWLEICTLNQHRHFPKVGGSLRDCDLIYPGWDLHLPVDAKPSPGTTPTRPSPPPTPAPDMPHNPNDAETSTPVSPGDDGVAAQTPSATQLPQTGTRPDRRVPSHPPASTARPGQDGRTAEPGLSLPGGSWMDLGLAAAITAAAALVWRLRRRRYTPRPPSAHASLDDPDLAPMPDVVTQVRRGLRARTPHEQASLDHLLDDPDDVVDTLDDDTDTAGNPLDNAAEQEQKEQEQEQKEQEQNEEQTEAVPNLPALGNPMLTAWPPAGLGLTGPGAEAAARGLLASALAAGGIDDPHGRSSVVLPAAALATLLGAAAVNVPDTPRLTVTSDLSEALELLEEQTLHRTRLVYGHEVDSVADLRDADPDEEPLPPILLVSDATVPHERARIAALLSQGQRLDIHGVLLGPWPDGNTVVVAGDGTTTPAEGEASPSHPADVGRLTVITAAETAALLPTLAESHTGLPQPPPRTPAAGAHPATPTDDSDQPTADTAPEPATDPLTDAAPAADATRTPPAVAGTAGPDTAGPAASPPDSEDSQDPEDSEVDDGAAKGPGVVAVRVLGQPRIIGADPEQPLRAKAMELLVYLIARDGGATIDAMKEDLVPDAAMSKAPNRIHTYVYALRLALRRTGGPATYITHPRHRYQLNRDTLDVDLWRMREALAAAETATGDARVTALRQAVAAYHGPFADGTRYEWAEPYREAVRRQALDAHLALADALHDQPEQALAVLDAAIAHDPYAEELYQAAMRRHADLDDIDAIAARLTELTRRLEELDTEPTDQTSELAGALTDDVRGRIRRNPGAAA
ncbi:LysM peptidoglycan-binding domain-containing protein [Micromonospora sp. CPCC 205371]|nr:LysM peptidoglycan-binding domain-containing protein [Micromonospora sp. CPCC 205371]